MSKLIIFPYRVLSYLSIRIFSLELAELLNRAQASSFDDQRGSAVKNCELPEFLKPKNQQISMDDSLLYHSSSDKHLDCRPTEMVHRKLCASPKFLSTSDEQSAEEDFGKMAATFEEGDDTLVIPSHEEAERLFGGGVVDDDQQTDNFLDPNFTERKSLSDFGMGNNKTNNVSIVSVGTTNDEEKNCLTVANNCNYFKRTIRESRPPPPPYHRGHSRGSLKKSTAIDETGSLGDNNLNNFVEKRKGVYVDEEDDWQVDYV